MDAFKEVLELVKLLLLPLLWFMLRELRMLVELNHKMDIRVNTLEVIAGVKKSRSVFLPSGSE